jgi:hypothetical protein
MLVWKKDRELFLYYLYIKEVLIKTDGLRETQFTTWAVARYCQLEVCVFCFPWWWLFCGQLSMKFQGRTQLLANLKSYAIILHATTAITTTSFLAYETRKFNEHWQELSNNPYPELNQSVPHIAPCFRLDLF